MWILNFKIHLRFNKCTRNASMLSFLDVAFIGSDLINCFAVKQE